jgi:hypothetical protein
VVSEYRWSLKFHSIDLKREAVLGFVSEGLYPRVVVKVGGMA